MQQLAESEIYHSKHKVRVITATSLFDGHDATINIIRRILQDSGAEVIHLGHNRSVWDVVKAAIQEDAQGICVSSYQGGHMEYFNYMRELLDKLGASHIKIFGGGGGVIIPDEIKKLESSGIQKIFSPDDGRILGLQGMINVILKECDFSTPSIDVLDSNKIEDTWKKTASLISLAERQKFNPTSQSRAIPVIGITGTGGAGKSSLTDELARRVSIDFPKIKIAIISIDPSKRKTGGALLADRIRMNSLTHSDMIYMRSLATRRANFATSEAALSAIDICKEMNYDLIILETSGIGQSGSEVVDIADISIYVMTTDYGASTQLEKIDMIDFADFIVINKFERQGSLDALRDVRKQYRRSRKIFDTEKYPDETLPVFGTMASQFNDAGVNSLYLALLGLINDRFDNLEFISNLDKEHQLPTGISTRNVIVPPERVRYLSEISETIRGYKNQAKEQAELARELWHLISVRDRLVNTSQPTELINLLNKDIDELFTNLNSDVADIIDNWNEVKSRYQNPEFVYKVRGKDIKVKTSTESLSHLQIPKVALPRYKDWGEIVSWTLLENVPGEFPFTAGVYPFKRTQEDPTRMFAGEGPPERTNKRFHYLSDGQPAARLSTAFDSVTLYGEDPNERPDIFGKIGESGVSICTIEDMERLYAGFNLCSPKTSVSMTINGPAPIMLAFFFMTAVRQQVRKWVVDQGLLKPMEAFVVSGDGRVGYDVHLGTSLTVEKNLTKSWEEIKKLVPNDIYEEIKSQTFTSVRGTVQADILKEDQAQNTCIFSTFFSLKMMGDIQEYFVNHNVKNYYSVSISGYHIAEAGANPITQTAFTLANGFTYLEYYRARGLDVDKFAHNFSFFFSNGLDPEYSVIGRVARRIWAVALKHKYNAGKRSQMLKYHIQTSGRSLHAQEVDFNDIRTTLQALLAIYDNCNSLHTNAYDEAVTTPTEESVRRAMAIQLIINREFGLTTNENPNQGSYIIEELTELVEEAILSEFDRLTERGGVLGAMETQYQRGKIQEESLYYETLKATGDLPIMGVNTFLNPHRKSNTLEVPSLIRASHEEKTLQINRLREFQSKHKDLAVESLKQLQKVSIEGKNIFEELLQTVESCSLGQISKALYDVGGEYRRNL